MGGYVTEEKTTIGLTAVSKDLMVIIHSGFHFILEAWLHLHIFATCIGNTIFIK